MTEDQEFKIVDRRVLLETGVWNIDEVDVKVPGGEVHQRQILAHPGAVTVIPVDDSGSVVLVSQYRAAIDEWVLEACAGRMDKPGEEPTACAERELAEEVGLRAEKMERLSSILISPGYADELNHIFIAQGLSEVERQPDGPEEQVMKLVTMGLDEALDQVDSGKINDSKTVIGLLLAARRLAN